MKIEEELNALKDEKIRTNYNNEMIAKAKTASSAEKLKRMAAEEGIELTAEEAAQYYDFLHTSSSLSDKDLELVAGGFKERPNPKYKVGQRVLFTLPNGVAQTGIITYIYWVNYKRAWSYWVAMDDGEYKDFFLESHNCSAKVIS